MKALKKQFIAAIAMTLVAAIALGSSTYAWFANNTSVTATGLSIKAKSDNAFMLISADKTTAAEIQTQGKTTVDLATPGEATPNQLYPSAHETISKTADANTLSNWYTASGKDPSKVEMDTGTKKALDTMNGYIIHKTVYLTVSKGSVPVSNITVKADVTGTEVNACYVLVTSETVATEVSKSNPASSTSLGGVNENSVLQVDIYAYIYGNDNSIYSNNKDKLGTGDITLTFSGTPTAS
uniref:SipW-cognate class signal peptide n=1 Tax=uncultured bacterium fosmid pJB39A3 TaxID=1478063 RepID=A0A0H3U9M4_9BACT|nr:hypothetical protein [uncultured bacterium fosmid pJB39A3]